MRGVCHTEVRPASWRTTIQGSLERRPDLCRDLNGSRNSSVCVEFAETGEDVASVVSIISIHRIAALLEFRSYISHRHIWILCQNESSDASGKRRRETRSVTFTMLITGASAVNPTARGDKR